jgi:hypothetical protein
VKRSAEKGTKSTTLQSGKATERPFATTKDTKCLKKRKIMRTQINSDGHCLRDTMNRKKRVHHEERQGFKTTAKTGFLP